MLRMTECLLPGEVVRMVHRGRLSMIPAHCPHFSGQITGESGFYQKPQLMSGRIYLTNYRLIFRSHRSSRWRALFSIPIMDIFKQQLGECRWSPTLQIGTWTMDCQLYFAAVVPFIQMLLEDQQQLRSDQVTRQQIRELEDYSLVPYQLELRRSWQQLLHYRSALDAA